MQDDPSPRDIVTCWDTFQTHPVSQLLAWLLPVFHLIRDWQSVTPSCMLPSSVRWPGHSASTRDLLFSVISGTWWASPMLLFFLDFMAVWHFISPSVTIHLCWKALYLDPSLTSLIILATFFYRSSLFSGFLKQVFQLRLCSCSEAEMGEERPILKLCNDWLQIKTFCNYSPLPA